MKITVIGGGNIGTLMAAEMAHAGHTVTLYTGKPDRFEKIIEVLDSEERSLFSAPLHTVTGNLETAIRGAQMIWITLPAFLFEQTAANMLPFVSAGQIIGVVPGSGGAEFSFYPLLQKGCILCGLQRVHSIARLKEYGKSVYMLGKKSELMLGSIPAEKAEMLSHLVQEQLGIPTRALPNYLAITLTPSNPILHTTRLYAMFRDGLPGQVYPRNILFYEEWDDPSSEALFACNRELMALCSKIPLDLSDVISLPVYYESDTPAALTKKIAGIAAFRGLTSPMVQVEDGWIPDLSSRYFTADFSYGLKIILELCALFSVDAPAINAIWQWYLSRSPEAAEHCFTLSLSKEQFLALYR